MKGHSKGFTLAEMMIAVAILVLLLGIGMPSFQSFIANSKIRTTAEALQAGLHLARTEALRRNVQVSFWLVNDTTATCARSNASASWVVSQNDPANGCNAASSTTAAPRIVQVRSGDDGSANIVVNARDSTNAAANCITFNGFGRVQASCAGGGNPISTIRLTSAATGRELRIRVDESAIRMCNPSVASTDPTSCQ